MTFVLLFILTPGLQTTTEELFSNENLMSKEAMYSYILNKIDTIKEEKSKLQILYRVVKDLYLS